MSHGCSPDSKEGESTFLQMPGGVAHWEPSLQTHYHILAKLLLSFHFINLYCRCFFNFQPSQWSFKVSRPADRSSEQEPSHFRAPAHSYYQDLIPKVTFLSHLHHAIWYQFSAFFTFLKETPNYSLSFEMGPREEH